MVFKLRFSRKEGDRRLELNKEGFHQHLTKPLETQPKTTPVRALHKCPLWFS